MKAKTIQIVWHTKEPVWTLDFHPTNTNVLATGGADKDIKVCSLAMHLENCHLFALSQLTSQLFPSTWTRCSTFLNAVLRHQIWEVRAALLTDCNIARMRDACTCNLWSTMPMHRSLRRQMAAPACSSSVGWGTRQAQSMCCGFLLLVGAHT